MQTIPLPLVAPLFNPATFAIPGAVDELLKRLREEYPLSQAAVPGYDKHWIVMRHADIQFISRQNELFHNADRSATLAPVAGEELVRQFTDGDYNLFRSLVQLDGQEHKSHRKVLMLPLSPLSVTEMEARIRLSVDEELGKLIRGNGTIDFVEEIASSYPLHVVMDTIGVPREDQPEMLKLTQWLFSWADPDLMRPGSDPTSPEQQAVTWKIVFDRFHDLKHTFGRRLRAANVPLETRKVLLGHRNGDITTHYSAPELEELLVAVNKVCEEKSGKSPALVMLKQKTAGA